MCDELSPTRLSFPCFLPNPSRILLGALDVWLQSSENTASDREAVVRALRDAVCDGRECSVRFDSIPVLIQSEALGEQGGSIAMFATSDELLQ